MTTITKPKLEKLGFVHVSTASVKNGTLELYRYPKSMIYVGVDSRFIPNDTRIGFYNTKTTLEKVVEAVQDFKIEILTSKK